MTQQSRISAEYFFCNSTPLQIIKCLMRPICFCVLKVHTGVHRVTALSGIGVHSRQRGGDLRKCLKANSLPQIGWHLGCWDWGNSMLRLLPLLGLAAALPMVPSDQSSVSFFCVILNSWFLLHLWHLILFLSGFFRWMPLLWLYPTWFSHLVACSQQNLCTQWTGMYTTKLSVPHKSVF